MMSMTKPAFPLEFYKKAGVIFEEFMSNGVKMFRIRVYSVERDEFGWSEPVSLAY